MYTFFKIIASIMLAICIVSVFFSIVIGLFFINPVATLIVFIAIPIAMCIYDEL